MDWIERWFGAAPDNGDGTLELLLDTPATGWSLSISATARRIAPAIGAGSPAVRSTRTISLSISPAWFSRGNCSLSA